MGKSLLRFTTAGSVDDGKSTLIGRLLHDTNGAYDDQIEAVRKSRINRSTGPMDFSLLTDGLRAEREQGITIDVAYRYFETPRRKFIIADTPGHQQYTRNMATGASTADVAVILVDARHGIVEQSRRHARISTLLGIRNLVVAVNKMDLVGFDSEVFERISEDALKAFDGDAAGTMFIPISALEGDNVVEHSRRTRWYSGPSLLEYLETVDVAKEDCAKPFRFPVQLVIRPNLDFRGFAGAIVSGRVEAGQEVLVLPSNRTTRVKRIATFDGDLRAAHAPMSVTLELEDEIDLSRGGVIADVENPPRTADWLKTSLIWMNDEPLETGKSYLLRHGPREVRARIQKAPALGLNDIGEVVIETTEPLVFDPYIENRSTGAFIVIDAISNLTVAAGMIESAERNPFQKRGALMPDPIAEARNLIEKTLLVHLDQACVTCSFQAEDLVVLHLLRQFLPQIPVLFIETGYHFAETYAYRDRMTREWDLNLVNLASDVSVAQQESQLGILYRSDPGRCCQLRKVAPLMTGLERYKAWFTGLRREQSPTRRNLQVEEAHVLPSGSRIAKISPLAAWTWNEVLAYATLYQIPLLPLYEQGYPSIGCEPCTQKPLDPSDPRSGRWSGQKLECGIHTFTTSEPEA